MVGTYISAWNRLNSLGPVADVSVAVSPYAYGNLCGGFSTSCYTSVKGVCFFKLVLWGLKS